MTTEPTGSPALRARTLGFRFGAARPWVLRECDFALPARGITALVGRNGAGKTTLLHLATDLRRPTTGSLEVFGEAPSSPGARAATAFVAQDRPLYPRYTVADTLRLGRSLNGRWDQETAERLVRSGSVGLEQRVGALSGGQQTRVALAMALGKRPDLLLLDEPLADLDPVVRESVLGALMAEVADRDLAVVLSSHVLPDIENTCDHVLVLREGALRLNADTEDVREGHRLVTGHVGADGALPAALTRGGVTVVEHRVSGRQFDAIVRLDGPAPAPSEDWVSRPLSLEDALLGYLRSDATGAEAPALAGTTGSTGERGAA